MSTATDTYLLLRAFVDELTRCGMRDACTSPGSRCAPLLLTLAREPRLNCHSHIDERCAGFFALGLAKVSGRPVAVTCTSGTAAAQLLPAVIEAHEARVPLMILTADRPPELRENGAGQTIDQLKLYGNAAKWFVEVDTHEASPARLRWMRTLACRAYWTALEGRPGAVHLNFALREPLILDEPLPEDRTGRPDGRPYVRRLALVASGDGPVLLVGGDRPSPRRQPAERGSGVVILPKLRRVTRIRRGPGPLMGLLAGTRRGVLIAGRHERDTPLGEAAEDFCAALEWPLLADPMSGARRGESAVAHYDALLRDGDFARAMSPDLVLRVGDLPTSKPLRTWLAGLDAVTQVSLDPEGAWQDPDSVLSSSLAIEPANALSELVAGPFELDRAEEGWLAQWRRADELAASAITAELAASGLSEPVVAAELGRLLPATSTLFVASSMPVRDIETFWPALAHPPRVLCNRGANGIDGTVSSAFGAAAAGDGEVILLIGDVALAHDLGGLLAARRLDLKVTIVAIDNEGGGIFDFLPVSTAAMARTPPGQARPLSGDADQASDARPSDGHPSKALPSDARPSGVQGQDIYTHHISTPPGLDFSIAAALYGLHHERVDDVRAFRVALERAIARPGSSVLEVQTERAANVDLHRRVWAAVGAHLGLREGELKGPTQS